MRTASLVVGVGLLSFFLGRWTTGEGTQPPGSEASEARAPSSGSSRSVTTARTPVDCDEELETLQEENAQLAARSQVQDFLVNSLTKEAYGVAPEWPEDLPADYGQQGFQEVFEEVLEKCNPGVEVMETDCSEPPCLVVLRPRSESWHSELVNDCPAWNEAYGHSVTQSSGKVTCPDGSEESMVLVGPSVGDFIEKDPEQPWNVMKRLRYRASNAEANWVCQGD